MSYLQHGYRGVITYPVGKSGQLLILSDEVLAHLERHRQSTAKSKEAGGQLFAQIDGYNIIVSRATGPRRSDRRSLLSFLPNRMAERREIKRFFKEGFHYVGDWHTHPESVPEPSGTDIHSFREVFRKSRHQLAGFVMIIVGTAPIPRGLFVALSDGRKVEALTERKN